MRLSAPVGHSPAETASAFPAPLAARLALALLALAAAAPAPAADAAAGRIVFDSNRSGSFGIYTVAEDGSDLRTVVDSPQHEMYPDVSPDGRWVVYSRNAGNVTFTNSQVRICRPDGSADRLLDPDGSFPRFHPPTGHVYFMRGRYSVMILDPGAATPARRLFPPEKHPRDRQIVLPALSPSGRQLAFTSNHPLQWCVVIVDLDTGQESLVGRGCEPVWAQQGQTLLWVSPQGTRERSGILALRMHDRSVVTLQDDDAPWGHEYFPWVDPDARRLLWSACPPGQHPHEWSNYQVFIRHGLEGRPVRVTHDEFTNRWPKWFRPAGP